MSSCSVHDPSVDPFGRTNQCKACPWKVSTNPHTDIPGGYSPELHARLEVCTGEPGASLMGCHESLPGKEQACVGWLVWAIGPGNSIPLRLAASRGDIPMHRLKLDGEQHPSLVAMLATGERPPRKRRNQPPRRIRKKCWRTAP